MEFKNGKYYLFENEEILKEFADEYHTYYITKGFKYYYLYMKSYYPDRFSGQYTYITVATGKKEIEKYIKENGLKEVK